MSETKAESPALIGEPQESAVDAYFSADVETDGPIPGPFSMLSFAIVYAGSFDGQRFERPKNYERYFYQELKPISNQFQEEALKVNGLDRDRLIREGLSPEHAMTDASRWVISNCYNAESGISCLPAEL